MKKIISMILLVVVLGVMTLGFTSCGNKTVEYGPYTIGVVHSGNTVSEKNATINSIKSLQAAIGSDDLTIYIIADNQKLAEEIKKSSGNEHNDVVKISAHSEDGLDASVRAWFYNDEGEFSNVKGLQVIIATTSKAVNACKGYVKTVPVVGNAVSYEDKVEFEFTNVQTGETAKESIKIPSALSVVTTDKTVEFLKNSVNDLSNKKVAFVYDGESLDSKKHVESIIKALEENLGKNGELVKCPITVENALDLIKVEACDVIYVAHDNRTVANADKIAELNTDKVTVITQSEELFDACGDKALVINYDVVGTNAADIAFDILVNGKGYESAANIGTKLVSVAREKSK